MFPAPALDPVKNGMFSTSGCTISFGRRNGFGLVHMNLKIISPSYTVQWHIALYVANLVSPLCKAPSCMV